MSQSIWWTREDVERILRIVKEKKVTEEKQP